jgi:hypothetical protein
MARGAAAQENTLNQAAGQQLSNANSVYGNVSNSAAQLMNPNSPIVNSMVKSATTPVAAQTAAASTRLQNRASTSRNTAGLVSGEDQLARTAAQQGSQAAWGAQSGAFKTGLQAEGSLYAPAQSSADSLYGNATKAMDARTSPLQWATFAANLAKGAGGAMAGGGG